MSSIAYNTKYHDFALYTKKKKKTISLIEKTPHKKKVYLLVDAQIGKPNDAIFSLCSFSLIPRVRKSATFRKTHRQISGTSIFFSCSTETRNAESYTASRI